MFAAAALSLRLFAAEACDKGGMLLGIFPKWYEYLPYEQDPTLQRCEVHVVLRGPDGLHLNPLLPIGLAIIDILLRLIALVSVGYIIYGAFRYMTSQGEPDNIKAAQSTIINALIGLAIAIIAAASVAFIGHRIGG